jgi:hypothetical protein
MIRDARVGNVRTAEAGHVASDATIPLSLPLGQRCGTALIGVAIQAALAIEPLAFRGGGYGMGIVTGSAEQLPLTGREAAARFHLLELADGAQLTGPFWIADAHGDKLVPGKSRPIFPGLPPAPGHTHLSLEVALPANVLLQGGVEMSRIDDGSVDPFEGQTAAAFLDVELSRSMAPLAADGGLEGKKRFSIAVDRTGNRVHLVDMAEEAFRVHGSAPALTQVEARRNVPALLLTEPTDRGLPEGGVLEGEVGPPARPGADGHIQPDGVRGDAGQVFCGLHYMAPLGRLR